MSPLTLRFIMQHIRSRGFTLIELLVVIAIIGILSSVVLASLNSARNKGNDVGVRANMATIATQAGLYYENNGNSYGTAADSCAAGLFTDPTITQAIAATDQDNGSGAVTCYAADSVYAISSARPVDAASAFWCLDSTGKKCGTAADITGAACGACTTQN